ncbi:MAG: hypothetical protein U0166_21105 [Acidobacteriota bacterium]
MRFLPKRRRGQATIEYTLIVALVSIVLSYAFWFFLLHPRPGASVGRLVEFLSVIVDFVHY